MHKEGLMPGRRLFGGGPLEMPAEFSDNNAFRDNLTASNNHLNTLQPNELFQQSNGLPKIEIGPGPFKLVLDSTAKMIVPMPMAERDHFFKEFEKIEKIGEGEFGIAYRVKSKSTGQQWAVKKLKEEYKGVRDRDLRRQEVAKAFQICSVHEQTMNIFNMPNSKYCVGIVEAWEEQGYLYICSELCELGNLNDYILHELGLGKKRKEKQENTSQTIFCTQEDEAAEELKDEGFFPDRIVTPLGRNAHFDESGSDIDMEGGVENTDLTNQHLEQ